MRSRSIFHLISRSVITLTLLHRHLSAVFGSVNPHANSFCFHLLFEFVSRSGCCGPHLHSRDLFLSLNPRLFNTQLISLGCCLGLHLLLLELELTLLEL